MSVSPCRMLPLLATLAGVSVPVAVVPADDVGHGGASDEVRVEIEHLRREIDALRRERSPDRRWLDEARRRETAAVVKGILTDASSRTAFVDAGVAAGWIDDAFRIRSDDGDFELRFWGQVQIRYIVNSRQGDQSLPRNPPGTLWGLENRRTRVRCEGHVGDPRIEYVSQLGFRSAGGAGFLELAFLRVRLSDEWSLQVGQFRPRFLREFTVPATDQLAVERSPVAVFFNPGFAQGAQLQWQSDQVRIVGWAGDGLGGRTLARTDSQNTSWNESPARWAAFGRAEWKLDGTWGQFNRLSSRRGTDPGVLLGADMGCQQIERTTLGAGNVISTTASADLTIDFGGASLIGAFVWQRNEVDQGPAPLPWGVMVEGGCFVADDLELFGQYSCLQAESLTGAGLETGRWDGFFVGGNWYFDPLVKFTADWGINFASLSDTLLVANGAGIRVDEPGGSHQWLVRLQMQLLF